MKKFSKVAALVLACVMILTACASTPEAPVTPPADTGTGTTQDTTQDATPADDPAEDDGREIVGNVYRTGLPIVRERESFTIFVDDAGTPEEKVMYQIWAEETNVDVNLELLPHPAVVERFNIMMNAGDYPDVVGGWLINAGRLMELGMRDRIAIPLGDLIAEWGPNMEAVLDLPNVRPTMTLPDGNIYSIPYLVGEPLVTFLPWINQTWLDNLGLSLPRTVDEFTNILRAFRDGDPRGDGVSVIPFSTDPQNNTIATMTGWWGLNAAGQSPYPYHAYINGEIIFAGRSQEFRDMLTWFSGLWAEGLLDPEMFTQDRTLWDANGRSGLFGVSTGYGPGDFSDSFEETLPSGEVIRRTHYVPLPVLRADESVTPVWRRATEKVGINADGHPVGATIFRSQMIITDNAENPPMIIRFIDHIFDLENSVQATWGPIGGRVERGPEPGTFIAVPEETLSDEILDRYAWGRVYTQALPRFVPPGFQLIQPEGAIRGIDDTGVASALYEPYLTTIMPTLWLPPEDISEFSQLHAEVNTTYMVEFIANVTVGNLDITSDAVWERHLSDLDALGQPRLTEIINTALRNRG